MMKSVVKSIGEQAISEKEPLLILFDESATDELKKFSVVQAFEGESRKALEVGSSISFDEQNYTVTQVGPIANKHLQSMGHVTVVFKETAEEDQLANALYVAPFILPEIKTGTIITYN